MSTLPQIGLISIAELEGGVKAVNLNEDELPKAASIYGRWSTIRIPIDATPDGQITYREVPVEISRSIDFKEGRPDYSYRVNMMPFGSLSNDEQVNPALERRRAELEAQRDMYRGDNIDHLTPEDLLAPRADYFEGWDGTNDDDNDDDSSADDSSADDSDDSNAQGGESNNTDTPNIGDTDADCAETDSDSSSVIVEPGSPSTTNPSGRPVLPAKLPDDFTHAGPPGGFPESSYRPTPTPGWPMHFFENDIGDARYAFEHADDLNEGEHTQLVGHDSDQSSFFAHDEPEPPHPLEIIVKTKNSKVLRIFPDDKIVLEQNDNLTATQPYTDATMIEACWSLIHEDCIVNFAVVDDADAGVRFDISWVRRHAAAYVREHRLPLDTYQAIQDQAFGSNLSIAPEVLLFIYDHLEPTEAHYLLRLPLAPVLTWRLEENQTDGSSLIIDDQNLSVSQFIKRIYLDHKWHHHHARLLWNQSHPGGPPFPRPPVVYQPQPAFVDEWEINDHTIVPEHYDHVNEPVFDLQQMDWVGRIGITEREARDQRDKLYQHCRSEKDYEAVDYPPCDETMNRVRFNPEAMHTRNRASTPHFQLRNHFAVQDHLRYMYSDGSRVWSEYNWSSDRISIMDFGNVTKHDTFVNPISISTLALSTDHPRSVCMIGGLNGEFAYKSLLGNSDVLKSNPIATGYATTTKSGVINHIDIDYHNPRQSHHAVISCNDHKIRTLDLESGYFLNCPRKPRLRDGTETGHSYDFAINCTATCPDGRLIVAIGDYKKPLIIRADDGSIEQQLDGHSDHGFACAWSPDGRYVATAAQDRLVNIYDTRTWRILSTFSSHVSTHRSMRFSPVGGGARCLLLAEEADRVTVVNAHTFSVAQTHSFYGSIMGCDFEHDGRGFWVANGDEKFGGFMRYERTGYGQMYGLSFTRKEEIEADGERFEEEGPDEWILDEDRVRDPRCVNPSRHGGRFLGRDK